MSMASIRPTAVAGTFYPADGNRLQADVDGFLEAAIRARPAGAPRPKALIAPHAGYVYSGAVAGSAYARIAPMRDEINRVVLLGPTHRVAFRGLAVPSVQSFASPLGPVPLDREAIAEISTLPGVQEFDEAHAEEHSLEVHLPFLQHAIGDFELVPVVVGDATPDAVAQMLERLWGGPETLIVISSDLSHYHDYDTARTRDNRTTTMIETLRLDKLTSGDACGARPIAGLLRLAQQRDLRATTLDIRNSGDTAGPRDRVVGYGAWSLTEAENTRTSEAGRTTLLAAAARAIRNGLNRGRRAKVRLGTFGREIEAWRGSFVTLTLDGRLRGCIGSLAPRMPLISDVVWNGYSSAFEDPRFKKLSKQEFPGLSLTVSILGAPGDMTFADQEDLLAQLRPGVDGLILRAGENRGIFLPQVWEQIPKPPEFLARLKRKAGLEPDFWSDDIRIERFTAESFAAPVKELPI